MVSTTWALNVATGQGLITGSKDTSGFAHEMGETEKYYVALDNFQLNDHIS